MDMISTSWHIPECMTREQCNNDIHRSHFVQQHDRIVEDDALRDGCTDSVNDERIIPMTDALKYRMFLTSKPRSDIRIQRLAKALRRRIMGEWGPLESADVAVLDFAMDHWLRAVRYASDAARLERQSGCQRNATRIGELRKMSGIAGDDFARLVAKIKCGDAGDREATDVRALEVGGAA
jgi:hypothetical protein